MRLGSLSHCQSDKWRSASSQPAGEPNLSISSADLAPLSRTLPRKVQAGLRSLTAGRKREDGNCVHRQRIAYQTFPSQLSGVPDCWGPKHTEAAFNEHGSPGRVTRQPPTTQVRSRHSICARQQTLYVQTQQQAERLSYFTSTNKRTTPHIQMRANISPPPIVPLCVRQPRIHLSDSNSHVLL